MIELWIKVKDKEDFRAKEMEIAELSAAHPGEYFVVIYCDEERIIERTGYRASPEAEKIFIEWYGADNVKCVEKKDPPEERYSGSEPTDLERIANALEGMEKCLLALAGCISESRSGKQFCVAGTVTTYEP